MIKDRDLKPGTVLVARYKKRDHRCEVVKGEEGRALYRLKDGREFRSPSAAGSAVMGGVACNGWRLWTVEGTEAKAAKKAKSAAKPNVSAKRKGKAKKARKVAGGSTGEQPAPVPRPTNCGDCSQEFPTSREAADHMREEHGSAEAAGSGGR